MERLAAPSGEALATLSDAERARAARYVREDDRHRSLLGAALLRRTAGVVAGVAPGDVVVERRCPAGHTDHGRPALPRLGLGASLSHAGDLVVVALTSGPPVGVDVEPVPGSVEDALVDQVHAAGEPRPPDAAAFARTWVRKEAVVKATGDGLARPLSEVVLQPGSVSSYRGSPLTAVVLDLEPLAPGHVGAVAVLAASAVLVRR